MRYSDTRQRRGGGQARRRQRDQDARPGVGAV